MSITYIEYNNQQIYIPADCSFNTSNAWQTVEKKSTDSSGSIQNIIYLQKKGIQPKTYQVSFVLYQNLNENSLFDEIPIYEGVIGKQIKFVYANKVFDGLVISDISFALSVDAISSMTALQISINMKESVVLTQSTPEIKNNTRFV